MFHDTSSLAAWIDKLYGVYGKRLVNYSASLAVNGNGEYSILGVATTTVSPKEDVDGGITTPTKLEETNEHIEL